MPTLLKLPFLGSIRHMKRIGEDPQHKALRARNEARLAALKASNRLYEDKRESTPSGNDPVSPYSSLRNLAAAQLAASNAGLGSAYNFGGSGLGGLGSSCYWPDR